MRLSVFDEKIDADLLARKEFFDDDPLIAADVSRFLKSDFQLVLVQNLLDALGTVSIHGLHDQRIVKMRDLRGLQFVHHRVSGGRDPVFNEGLFHQFLIGNRFGGRVIDVPRQAEFLCDLCHDEKDLIRAHGDDEIDLFLPGDPLDPFKIKDIDLMKTIRVFFCERSGAPVDQDRFDSAFAELIDQRDLRQSACNDQCFHNFLHRLRFFTVFKSQNAF